MEKLFLNISFLFISIFGFTQIPLDSLQLNYSFNNNANDLSDNQLHGSLNGPLVTADRFGNPNSAYSFDGDISFISVPNDDAIKPNFPFSISVWVKIDSLTDDSSIIYASDETVDIYSGFWVGYISSGEISAGYGDGLGRGSEHRITKHSNIELSLNTWYNIIAVFNDLNDIQLFIDCHELGGYYSGSANMMVDLNSNGAIGRSLGHHEKAYHHGQIDDIRLYNKSLNSSEIDSLCNEPNPVRVGLNDLQDPITIKVFPNPSSGDFTIKTPQDASVYAIEIYDLKRLRLIKEQINRVTNETQITGLANGIYLIKALNMDNQVFAHKKVIIQY